MNSDKVHVIKLKNTINYKFHRKIFNKMFIYLEELYNVMNS